MAEKYGTIPKLFTKQWWEYFWDYYKIHTIVVLVLIFSVIYTVNHVINSPKYDFYLTYTAEQYMGDEQISKLSKRLNEYAQDVDGNGEVLSLINQYSFSESFEDAQLASGMITKLQLEFVTNDTMLFIFSDEKAYYLFDYESMEGAFQSVSAWVDGDINDKSIYKHDGVGYGVSLENSTLLNELGIPCDNLYVGIRNTNSNDENVISRLNSSIKIANMLIK